jgi:hypothetical protein
MDFSFVDERLQLINPAKLFRRQNTFVDEEAGCSLEAFRGILNVKFFRSLQEKERFNG